MRNKTTIETIDAQVYLVEAQTLDGLSGSPAFVHEIIDLPDFDSDFVSKPEIKNGLWSLQTIGHLYRIMGWRAGTNIG